MFGGLTVRQQLQQFLNLATTLGSAFMMWKAAGLFLNTESPIVVVLSESMEPAFHRGDLLFLAMPQGPVRPLEIPVFKSWNYEIPIVHRTIRSHQTSPNITKAEEKKYKLMPEKQYVLTKGDHNKEDDRMLYSDGERQKWYEWLHDESFMGRVYGYYPYMGMLTILINDYPILKVALIGTMAFFILVTREN